MNCDPQLRSERRRSSRILAIPNETRLEWTAPGRRQTSRGTVLNVSQSGALVATDAVPEMNDPLLIRLRKPVQTDWGTARAVRFAEGNRLGIEFTGTTPYDFILGATLGIDLGRLIANLPEEDRFTMSTD
jgi:PilZ domain